MSINIAGESYPEDVWGVVNHRELGQEFHEYCEAEKAQENMFFLRALLARKPAIYLYEHFIKTGASYQVSIPCELRQEAAELAENGGWNACAWQEILDTAQGEANRALKLVLYRFWTSDRFRSFYAKKGGDRSATKAVQTLLGNEEKATTPKDLAVLKEAMFLFAIGRESEAEEELKNLAQKEKDAA